MRYRLDESWQRTGRVVIAGSPLRLFRLTAAGATVAERLESGADIGQSMLVDRLLDGGAIHPTAPGRTETSPSRFSLDDVTVVTPQLGGVVHADGRVTVDDGSIPLLDGARIRLDPNRGPAGARNAARPILTTPLVAFLDADVSTADPVWFESLLWHFDDDRVALVAPRVRGEASSPLDMGADPARVRAGSRVSYVPGAALLVRVEALEAIGWFDEGLRFGEDVDLVWRLDEARWRCRFDPSASVWHRPRATWTSRLRQHAAYGTSAAPLAMRHPRSLSPVGSNGWTAAAWSTAVLGAPVAGVALAIGSSVALAGKLDDLPAGVSFRLAMRGHLAAGRQLAAAVRRVWWPFAMVAALVSKRCRWLALLAIAADIRATPTDVAYGWGVWASMRRHRCWAPMVPRLSPWPPRRRH